MIQLFIGIILGIILVFFIIAFYPSRNFYKRNNKEFILKTASKNNLDKEQADLILASLHQCRDLYWLNVLLLKFWVELSNSSAQAYRFKKMIKKTLDDIPGTGIIRFIEVLNIDIGNKGPIIQNIRIVDREDVENIFKNAEKNISDMTKKFYSFYLNKDNSVNCAKVYEEIFENVHTVMSVLFKGSIKIDLKITFPKNLILHTNVFINEIEGDILLRFPSINHSTRLEYTFLTNPIIKMKIDGGVSKGESEEYFKGAISRFLHRTVRFSILKTLVYPSFNSIYLPLIVPNISQFEHKIEKVTVENHQHIYKISDSISILLALDYKIIEVVNDITLKCNNNLLNDNEKIHCAKFSIPESALNSSHFTKDKNFIYENLTIKESKIMNQFYDLSIFKNVISSFRSLNTIHNFNGTSSLVELIFLEKNFEFIRIVQNDMIIFQRNDEQNPDFIVFCIRDKSLFIYSYITNSTLKMTKSRICKLKKKLEKKVSKKISINKIFQYSKKAMYFWKSKKEESSLEYVDDVKNILEIEKTDDFINKFEKILDAPICSKPNISYKFSCAPNIIFDLILQDEIRVKFFSDQIKIFRVINENDRYKKIAIESRDDHNDDFILHTFNSKNTVYDVIDNKKIIYEVVENNEDQIKINEIKSSVFTNDYGIEKRGYNNPVLITYPNLKGNVSEEDLNYNKNSKIMFLDADATRSPSFKTPSKTILNIYIDEGISYTPGNQLYESIYTRIMHQSIINLTSRSSYERLELKKELRKDFYGGIGGVYLEFKTNVTDDFIFTLYSTTLKKNILKIQKLITSKLVKMIIPILEEDILLLKLVPKFQNNKTIDIKVVNLPDEYHKESLIDCHIGLSNKGTFTFPINGSQDSIIFWEKDKEDTIKGQIESPYTKVPILGNGTMRTDKMNYKMIYKNNGIKCREIKIFMGVTKK
ncbi:SMP-LTD domain-containing protein [Vairimorpha necatrix]|uniref:SMP-LTD domain-containing protein n=1 Tax=Vairimorpha necatrix TaxID=6039 RepID=A0AAX4JA59_9MICR